MQRYNLFEACDKVAVRFLLNYYTFGNLKPIKEMIHEINRRIDQARELDFGSILNESIELFKKVWVQGLVMMVLTMAFMIPFYIIMYIPLIAMGILESQNSYGEEPSVFFLLIFGVLMLFMMFAIIVITTGLRAAFYRICMQRDLEISSRDDYFYFLKKPYLGKTISVGLITMGIAIVFYIMCVIPIFYALVPIAFINIVYAFNPDFTVSDIVKTAFKIGNKKWLLSFGLILIAGIMAQFIGMLMCLVGIFVTASFALLPLYFIYKHVVGFDFEKDFKFNDSNKLLE